MKQGDLFGGAAPVEAPKPAAQPAAAATEARLPPPKAVEPPVPPVRVAVAPPAASTVSAPTARVSTPAPPRAEPAWRRPTERRVLSVSELTLQIKQLLEPQFSRLVVRGEVSGFRGPNSRGHLYFSIKDRNASVGVTMWQSTARALKFALRDGMSVVVDGELNVYEPSGRYSLIAQRLEPEGVGARALAFEQLKQRLATEGLIGDRRTKPRLPLPAVPKRVGVATSLSGAALRDFLKVLHRRNPRVSVLVCDARVQGEGASWEVARAIRWLCAQPLDVVVVTRGGGSVDDLWTFNEEPIARAIFASTVPVVSAVGHEIDTTLADLVADLRAPTPSAAAEAVTPVLMELELALRTSRDSLRRAMERQLGERRAALAARAAKLGDPRRRLTQQRLTLTELSERMTRVVRRQTKTGDVTLKALLARLQRARPGAQMTARRAAFTALRARLENAGGRVARTPRERLAALTLRLERSSPAPRVRREAHVLQTTHAALGSHVQHTLRAARERLAALNAQLDALSPLKVLSRGYAIAQRTSDGRVVRRAADVAVGDALTVRVDGDDRLEVSVTQVKPRTR